MGYYQMGLTIGREDIQAPSAYQVGLSLYHTVGDRERALEQLNTEFHAVSNEVVIKIRKPNSLEIDDANELTPWARSFVFPVVTEWEAFYTSQHHFGKKFFTDWSAYEQWQDRLKSLRDAVRGKLGSLQSPEPEALPLTIWQQGGAAAQGLVSFFKTIIIVGVIIFGGYLLITAVMR